ncbi:MAG: DUF4410 domain-containing protein [Paludibacteraceae bacterium]|nr:DUF4410 domain-containing protein [Paludibacteraceae bacterium]
MRKLFSVVAILLAVVFTSSAKDKIAVGEFEDWNGIDSVIIKEIFKLNDYNTIYLLPIDESKIEWPEKSDNRYVDLQIALKKIPTILQERIQKRVKKNVVLADKDQKFEDNSLKIQIVIEELNMGSRALRAWVGYGAGGQHIKISGTISDNNNKDFLNFKHKRISTSSASYEKCVEGEFYYFSEDISLILKQFLTK